MAVGFNFQMPMDQNPMPEARLKTKHKTRHQLCIPAILKCQTKKCSDHQAAVPFTVPPPKPSARCLILRDKAYFAAVSRVLQAYIRLGSSQAFSDA